MTSTRLSLSVAALSYTSKGKGKGDRDSGTAIEAVIDTLLGDDDDGEDELWDVSTNDDEI